MTASDAPAIKSTPGTEYTLASLPLDIKLSILEFCNPVSFNKLTETCHSFHAISRTPYGTTAFIRALNHRLDDPADLTKAEHYAIASNYNRIRPWERPGFNTAADVPSYAWSDWWNSRGRVRFLPGLCKWLGRVRCEIDITDEEKEGGRDGGALEEVEGERYYSWVFERLQLNEVEEQCSIAGNRG